MNRVFGNGDGGDRKREASPEQVADIFAAVRRGDPKVCVAFAREVVARLDEGKSITPLKQAKKARR
jgi:hypothetical protein